MVTDIRTVGDVRILDCGGKITLGEGTLSIRNAMRTILESGAKNVILNLSQVSYIDSSGLGELMRSHTSVANAGGRLKLLKINQRIRELLTVSKLFTLFEAYDDERDALASFSRPSPTCNDPNQ